jgi:acetoin utilization protein AcuB
MLVRDIMTTHLVTVAPDDTLAHATALLRQRQFHHLPVVKVLKAPAHEGVTSAQQTAYEFAGLLTSRDFDLTPEHVKHDSSSDILSRAWHEQRVAEVMDRSPLCVTSTASVGSAAHLFVERRLSCLPVIEYAQQEQTVKTMLVGIITRSDLLRVFAHVMGTSEPGMQLQIPLPEGDLAPLIQTLHILQDLHLPVISLLIAPTTGDAPAYVTLRLRTINPVPLFQCLKAAGIAYDNPLGESESYA